MKKSTLIYKGTEAEDLCRLMTLMKTPIQRLICGWLLGQCISMSFKPRHIEVSFGREFMFIYVLWIMFIYKVTQTVLSTEYIEQAVF